MKKILSILAAVALSGVMGVTASAQGYAVRGVVVDQIGPVVGASVIEAGTTNGSVTDLDGNFSFRVSFASTAELYTPEMPLDRHTCRMSFPCSMTFGHLASNVPAGGSSSSARAVPRG